MAISRKNADIIDALKNDKDLTVYENLNMLFEMARNIQEEDQDYSMVIARAVKNRSGKLVGKDYRFYDLYNRCLLYRAPYFFEDYLLYMEKDRDIQKQFYKPRERTLKQVVDDLQDLEDGVIKFYGLSLPSRTGKSTLCIFFMSWVMGRSPDKANLMSGHSDKLTEGFYDESLNFITNPEYNFADIFPGVKLENKSSKNEAINLNSKTRFPTLTCRSIDGTLTGAVEAENYLYCDDLIRDRTESLNPMRLENRYQDYLNVLVDRKKDGCKELMVGTRWNVMDPLGRIEKQYKDNPEYRFRKIPALNELDESNFNYDYNKGFSTEYYLDIKHRLDNNEWMSKYQQSPYLREGLLFPEEQLKTFNGTLPDESALVRKVAICDVSWGGDFLSMPFAYIYQDGSVYIVDVVFNNGDKDTTRPIVVGKTLHHRPNQEHFEANNGGHEYADRVDGELQLAGYTCSVTSAMAPSNVSKVSRIVQYQTDIRSYYYLKEEFRSKDYKDFINNLSMFVQIGKNDHDDAADSLAQLAAFLEGGMIAKCEPFRRPC